MKKPLLLTSACFLLFAFQTIAQKKFSASLLSNRSAKILNSNFTKYSLYSIPIASIADYSRQQKGQQAAFDLQLPGLVNWKFDITEHSILSEDYTLVENGPNGKSILPKPSCMTFTGHLSDANKSSVRLTIDNNIIYGMVKNGDKEYFIEPLRYFDKQANQDFFVVYDVKDVVPDPTLTCGVTETTQRNNIFQRLDAGTNSVQAQLAIASDVSMFTRYGSAAAVQTHNIGVMNNVIWDYVNAQFNDNIEFVIVTQSISTSAGTDQLTPAYTGTNSGTILDNFTAWGEAGNFGTTYDLAQFWTTRNIDNNGAGGGSGTVGLAWVGSVCTSARYHILEDFAGSNPTGSGYLLRVLASHEIGHNFNCVHDASGDPYIMAPSVGNTSTWSPASVAAVNSIVPGLVCLSPASNAGVPVVNFIGTPEAICVGSTMQLIDHSLQGPTSWNWSMIGGSPSSSTIRNPIVSYGTNGIKTITLTSANINGPGIQRSKSILVSNPPAAACNNTGTSTSDAGVKLFMLNTISNSSGGAVTDGNKYMDFTCAGTTQLKASTQYSVIVTLGDAGSSTPNIITFYIDYNNDGDFADAGELAYSSYPTGYVGSVSFNFTTPPSPATDQFLRTRIIAKDFIAIADNPCHNPAAGQVEDYAVYFASPILLPVSLLSFEGYHQNGKNILKWKTTDEKDNNYFDIETNKNGNNFYKIGRVDSKGNSYSITDYNFTDHLPAKGINYYRLKQVDINGKANYSKVISVTVDKTSSLFAVYPNPARDKLTIDFAEPSSNTLLQILTLEGKVVKKELYNNIQRTAVVDIDKLSSGVYIIQINSGSQLYNLKFVKE